MRYAPLLALPLALAAARPARAAILDPVRIAAAPAEERDYDAALAAARRLKEGAPESLQAARSMPVELAPVLRAVGYAGELPAALEREPAGALAFKKSYWGAHARALGRRLAELAAEGARRDRASHLDRLGSSSFDRRLALEEVMRLTSETLGREQERRAAAAALDRVEAVLADVGRDEAGDEEPQALIDRKIALFRRLSR